MSLQDYLELKDMGLEAITKEQAFRAGQATILALFADMFHMSLAYCTDFEKAVRDIFARSNVDDFLNREEHR